MSGIIFNIITVVSLVIGLYCLGPLFPRYSIEYKTFLARDEKTGHIGAVFTVVIKNIGFMKLRFNFKRKSSSQKMLTLPGSKHCIINLKNIDETLELKSGEEKYFKMYNFFLDDPSVIQKDLNIPVLESADTKFIESTTVFSITRLIKLPFSMLQINEKKIKIDYDDMQLSCIDSLLKNSISQQKFDNRINKIEDRLLAIHLGEKPREEIINNNIKELTEKDNQNKFRILKDFIENCETYKEATMYADKLGLSIYRHSNVFRIIQISNKKDGSRVGSITTTTTLK